MFPLPSKLPFLNLNVSDGVLISCEFILNEDCPYLRNGTLAALTWDQGRGPTPSHDTGPSAGVDDPHYIYLEATNHKEGDDAGYSILHLFDVNMHLLGIL